MLQEIAAKSRPDDFIVAHNARFDMEQCLRRSAKKMEMCTPDLDFILGLPRFCTQNCEYVKSTLAFRERRLSNLCEHFGVDFDESAAHDATYDSQKLAECVSEALFRGVMMPDVREKHRGHDGHTKLFEKKTADGKPRSRPKVVLDTDIQAILSRTLS